MAEIDSVYLPPGELTAVLGISDVEISRLARRGILPRIQNPEKPKYYLYPLLDCCREYIRHLKSRAQKDKDDYWAARAKSEKERSHAIATTNALRERWPRDATRATDGCHGFWSAVAAIPRPPAEYVGRKLLSPEAFAQACREYQRATANYASVCQIQPFHWDPPEYRRITGCYLRVRKNRARVMNVNP